MTRRFSHATGAWVEVVTSQDLADALAAINVTPVKVTQNGRGLVAHLSRDEDVDIARHRLPVDDQDWWVSWDDRLYLTGGWRGEHVTLIGPGRDAPGPEGGVST